MWLGITERATFRGNSWNEKTDFVSWKGIIDLFQKFMWLEITEERFLEAMAQVEEPNFEKLARALQTGKVELQNDIRVNIPEKSFWTYHINY